tara:strand:- start:1472 stop:2254 length:783 start_codon:yes stop_codon:yes gene_type:complete
LIELNKIYHEDCVDTMKKITYNTINCILTSPPYNTSRKGSSLDLACENIRYDNFNDNKPDLEYISWTVNIFNNFEKILSTNGVILYNLSYSSENTHLIWKTIAEIIYQTQFIVADCIVWKKKIASPNATSSNKLTRICEFVFVLCRKTEINSFQCNKEISSYRDTGQIAYKNYFNFIQAKNNDTTTATHKATFSSELVRKLIKLYCKKDNLIYDPFMGTGTTAKGCILENINYIGSEISKHYVDIANKRLKPYKTQTKLF